MARISVIGAGNVGATCAYTLLKNNVADVVLVDVVEGLARGKAIDMMQAGAIEGYDRYVIGTSDYSDIVDSEVVVITAGLARQPGMSRNDLLGKNAQILKSIVSNVVEKAPEAVLLVVTNPVDILAYLTLKISGYEPHRIVGMSGVLDSARYRYFISQELDTPMSSVEGMVIGAHGDSMLPVISQTKINGWPLLDMMDHEKAHEIIERTKNGGAEIVSYLKTGSAFYAPGAASAKMADAIVNNKDEIMPCCVYAQGQYGIEDIFIGLPARLGRDGVQEIVEIELSDVEQENLHQSAASVRNALADFEKIESSVI